MKLDKKQNRIRRAKKTRSKIKRQGISRLSVHRTPRHIYAQIIASDGASVLAAASTVEKEVRNSSKGTGNIKAATLVGERIAEKAKAIGVKQVAFDRSGFLYHGRIKALAEAARDAGLNF